MKRILKKSPVVPFEAFKRLVAELNYIISSHGIRYDVVKVTDTEVHFERNGANKAFNWSCNLKNLYKAYSELQSFETRAFKKYIPYKYLQARNLLVALGLLEIA